jgi:hypothetical protein
VSNFPTLDNEGDLVFLQSRAGKLIHAVEYNKSWYADAVKAEGGWSLEMIDPKNACSGHTNWKSSTDPKGGTPGKKNSVDAANPDTEPPRAASAFATDSMHINVLFDEPLDSFVAVMPSNYQVDQGIGSPVSATASPPLFNKITLRLQAPLERNRKYLVTVNKLVDCAGNNITTAHSIAAGLPSLPENLDVVINEVLFNPRPGGVDYLEIYNRSNRIVDVETLFLAGRGNNGAINSPKKVSPANRLLFPQSYLVITEDAELVKKQYLAKDPNVFVQMSSMPALADDKGRIVLLNVTGKIIDELSYDRKWHFKLVDNDEGIALERIDYSKPTQDPANWHSASTSSGYGTPGYRNSQFRADMVAQGTISIYPAVFSPDNDGFDDFVTINYDFPEPGYVCNISLYESSGRLIRRLTQNAICGVKGYFRWDGLDEKSNLPRVGMYVMMAEVFNLEGKTKKFKQVLTVARKLE